MKVVFYSQKQGIGYSNNQPKERTMAKNRNRDNKMAAAQWAAIISSHPRNRVPELKNRLRKLERLFALAVSRGELDTCSVLAAEKKETLNELRSI